jgi:hypothetical protein
MKEIILTQGKVTLVDDEDFEWLNQWKWYASKIKNNFYAKRDTWIIGKGRDESIFMHREILKLVRGDGIIGDHKNRNTLDNQKNNLRITNHSLNNYNCKMKSHNKSGYRGVDWYKAYKKWRVRITKENKVVNLGYFINKIEAAKIYDTAAIKLWKQDAKLNFPSENRI